MVQRRTEQLDFADYLSGPGVSRRDRFFDAVNLVIDWEPIEAALAVIHGGKMGRPGIAPLLLFKILLIQRWYGLGDPAAEDALNDSRAFARFVGLSLGQAAPNYSSISRFRTELIRRGLMEPLIQQLMAQIDAKGLVLREGTLMDATFVPSAARPPSAPRAKKTSAPKAQPGPDATAEAPSQPDGAVQPDLDAATQAQAEPEPEDPFTAGKQSRVDPDARWAKKGRKAFFGYKLHIAADQGRRFVRAHRVTVANVNDCTVGPDLVQPDGGAHYGDMGYPSQPLREALAEHGLADGIMQLGTKHYPLRPAQRRRNRTLAGIRSEVEGVFGEMKRRLGLDRARYFGLVKVQLECDLTVFAFNLKTMALAA
jgi:IS5 family transposase